MKIRYGIAAVLAAVMAATVSNAAEVQQEGVALTVYNQNFGVVREKRAVDVKEKLGWIRFADVASKIDGTSVQFKSVTDPEASVLEQNYEYDLVSADKLLQKYIDKSIKILTKDGSRYAGKLLSFDANQLVVRQSGEADHIVMVQRGDNVKDIEFGRLPEGLITKPTLVWKLATEKPGRHLVEVTYQTEGLNWRADYNAVLSPDDTRLDLGGWVTLDNRSGATYKEARLKLIAGDVKRVEKAPPVPARARVLAMEEAGAPAFEEKAFFEYHLYTLQRPATVAQNQTKQIKLLKASQVPVKKVFLYQGSPRYRFYGGLQTQPKGKVRLYKLDAADEALEFIGEDEVDHTPKDEKIRLHIGDAFDIVGERKRVDFHVDTGRKTMTESFEIQVRNHKEDAVEVLVKEVLYRWSNWEITEASHTYKKYDAQTIHFPVQVKEDGEQVITYTVRYTW
jgi:hypothetical protein